MEFTVGAVPVFMYLESQDVYEVGYTLRTASLMTDPEYFFDERNPGDYRLFGIHYLIVPSGYLPPVPAKLLSALPSAISMPTGRTWASAASRCCTPGSRNEANISGSRPTSPATPIGACRRSPKRPPPER
jgi:hypothetical protein